MIDSDGIVRARFDAIVPYADLEAAFLAVLTEPAALSPTTHQRLTVR